MTDAEKKKAYYIANAQGYCLEFRLSENTVSNYTEYTTERAHYAGPDGADGGNWKDLKQWLLANGFTCTWADKATPIKNGSDELGKDIVRAIRRNLPLPPLPGGSYIAGTLEGGSGKPHGNGEGDSVWYTNTDIDPYGELYFFHESIWLHAGGLYEILLVRPL